jgi:hypothetical protein
MRVGPLIESWAGGVCGVSTWMPGSPDNLTQPRATTMIFPRVRFDDVARKGRVTRQKLTLSTGAPDDIEGPALDAPKQQLLLTDLNEELPEPGSHALNRSADQHVAFLPSTRILRVGTVTTSRLARSRAKPPSRHGGGADELPRARAGRRHRRRRESEPPSASSVAADT